MALHQVQPATDADELSSEFALAWRRLAPARRTTGRERRWLDPEYGLLKRIERVVDRFTARHVFPHLLGIWHPYCWQLPRRFTLAVATIAPPLWPREVDGLRILHLSDIHCGAFLHPEILGGIIGDLMALRPDLVAVTGDIVEGRIEDLDGFLPALAPLARAPLGAWYCHGNHDYFTGVPGMIGDLLASAGIRMLKNESVPVRTGGGELVVGGIDDRLLGSPDWRRLMAAHGPPDLLLAHNPDDFYDAERRGIGLVLSGHTHGGQIRFPSSRPIVRQSRFCLDEGLYAHGSTLLVVSRGLGAVGLPWRAGAHPEAVLLRVRSSAAVTSTGWS
jgi:predicted MPP superfamily phosphohydrolase